MRFWPATALAATENGCTTRLAGLVTPVSAMLVGPTTGWRIETAPLFRPVNERLSPPVSLAYVTIGKLAPAVGVKPLASRGVDRAGQRGAAGDG